jgi:lipopolysaccharide/colanic/teichoic acid biosynthesis glycosyltransferase
MSVVGPRPERPNFVIHLQDEIEEYRLRHRVKPGITGLAQVHRDGDRSTDDVRAKVDYDLEYIRRRSLRLDLLIMLRTLPALFRRSDR